MQDKEKTTSVKNKPAKTAKEKEGKKIPGLEGSVTFRKLAAKPRYRKHVERYQNILENIHDGYFEVDLAGNFTFFNDSVNRILGYSSEELMEMNYRQYTDKESADVVSQAYNEVYKTGEFTEGFDWLIIRKDGTKRYIEASVSLLKDSVDKPKGFRSIIRDITERKLMEEKYRRIFENAQNGIYQSTLESKFIMANQSMARILGYDSPEDLISGITDISRQLYANPEDCLQLIEMMEKQGLVKDFEVQFRRKDGRIIWVSRTMQVFRNEKGDVLYYEGIIEDITDKRIVLIA